MRSRTAKMILPCLVLLLLGSAIIRLADLDLKLARHCYDVTAGGWKWADVQPWDGLYHLGPILVVVLGAVSILAFSIGLVWRPLRKWRKASLYLVACLALGPGLIVNGLLKDHWGRPRPDQLVEFGGKFAYEPVLTMDFSSVGKSFPCGHATLGFMFFALVFLLPGRRGLQGLAFWFALMAGLAFGVARIVQGGHFLSDVLWAGGICWLVSYALSRWFRLDESVLLPESGAKAWDFPPLLRASLFVVLLLITPATLLAFPRSKDSKVNLEQVWSRDYSTAASLHLDLIGEVEVVEGERLLLETSYRGFGFPKSKLELSWSTLSDGRLEARHQVRGHFTELHSRVRLILPEEYKDRITWTTRPSP